MKNSATWQFTVLDRQRSLWGAAAVMAGFLGTCIPGLVLNFSVGIVIGAVLLVTLPLMYFMMTWSWRQETITLYHDRMESALYGTVYFSDIRKITRPWGANAPGVKLRLANRRISWYMTRSSRAVRQNTPEEVAIFGDFLRHLEAALSKQEQKQFKTSDVKTEDTHPSPAAQLSQINNHPNDNTSLIVGATFILLITMVVAMCATRGRKPDLARMKAASQERFYSNKQKLDELVARRMEKEGGAFLYTNDHAATIKLLPEISTGNPLNIELFQYTEASRDIEAILANPDSAQLDIYIIAGDSAIRRMRSDTSERQFFFRAYDPRQHIRPAGKPWGDTTGQYNDPVLDVSWTVTLKDTSHMLYAIDRSIPGISMMLSQIRLHPSFRFYMTGKVKQGMNEMAFTEAVITLNKLLHRNKVDTITFRITRI
ncbi:hypothetical protein HF324_02850 [Chitinophaga oryzae]|uniref:DUF3137 domain-containing protein n=1 Tax=Chitinophaga oryzae TaxID=2725414 RepID=A0ABX6LA35_9BACT|nr:hypothetical protein [Chitinophaga oryzae]QJB36849.1 hypothetical protein HF324_02850 [Chitinophaga oryzae]